LSSYLVLNSGYTGRLMNHVYFKKLNSVIHDHQNINKCDIKLSFIADNGHGKSPLVLFDKTLNGKERPNKLDRLLDLAVKYGSVVFNFNPKICSGDAVEFANNIMDIEFCTAFGMGDVDFRYDIFNTNKINMNHRYFSDMLMILDKYLLRDISTMISDYIDMVNRDDENAVVIDWDCESG
jgi:hypothetical protein